jgi:uncharacterized protein YabE (DUF348 family)
MRFLSRKTLCFVLFLAFVFFGYKVFAFFSQPDYELNLDNSPKKIVLNDNGFFFETETSADTISDFLQEKNIVLGEHDQIIPEKNAPFFSKTNLLIRRAAEIKIEADGKTTAGWALEKNVSGAIAENNISLGDDDLVKPGRDALAYDGKKLSPKIFPLKPEKMKTMILAGA